MTQYNTLNVKLSSSQLTKLNSVTKDGTKAALNLSSNVVGDSVDENNFPHKLLLTNTQVSQNRKAFANGSSVNIKLSRTQLYKTVQSGGFSGRLLGPLLITGLPLIRNALTPSAKSVLISLGLTAAASETDAATHKKMFGSGFTTLIISIEQMNNIMKIVKSLEESGLLIKGVNEKIKNEAKEQKGGFIGLLLGNLGASSLGNLLTGKGTISAGEKF